MKRELRLYIAGDDAISRSAIANFNRIIEGMDAFLDTKVVDIVDSPESARSMRIMATPTLVRVSPKPIRKVIGDLTDKQRVMTVLGLQPPEEQD